MRQVHQFGLVALGGSLGAFVRLGLANIEDGGSLGTLLANVVGCAALGLLAHSPRPDRVSWFAATGFCGGLTTMSTFAVEVVNSNSLVVGFVYAVVSVVLGLAAFITAKQFGLGRGNNGSPFGLVITALVIAVTIAGLGGGIAEFSSRGIVLAFGFFVAASLGAGLRGALSAQDSFDSRRNAVLAINVVGAFALGFLVQTSGWEFFAGSDSNTTTFGVVGTQTDRAAIFGIGGLGAFTTFSTAIAHIERMGQGDRRGAVSFAGAMFILIIGAAAIGAALA